MELPMTYFHLFDNKEIRHSIGINAQVNELFSLYFFKENGLIETLLYQWNKTIGQFLGQKLSVIIKAKNNHYDGIIGVPFHPKRKRKRGYNQIDIIGRSIANACGIPYV